MALVDVSFGDVERSINWDIVPITPPLTFKTPVVSVIRCNTPTISNDPVVLKNIKLGLSVSCLDFALQLSNTESFFQQAYDIMKCNWFGNNYDKMRLFSGMLKPSMCKLFIQDLHLYFLDCDIIDDQQMPYTHKIQPGDMCVVHLTINGMWFTESTYGIRYDIDKVMMIK